MATPDWLRNLGALSLQIALVAAAGALAAAALRVRRPRVMLGYWQALLWVALLLPLLQPWRVGVPAGGTAGVEWSASTAVRGEPLPWPEALAAGLLAGLLVRSFALAGGLRRLAGLRRRAVPWEAAELLAQARSLVGGEARLLLSPDVRVPATFGFRRAAILLPEAFPHLPLEQQRHVLCHELLHVRRGDWAVTVAEEALRVLFWFHPAVAWLIGRIRLAREQVVDLEVVRSTRARQAYLETLLAMARVSTGAVPAPLAMFLRESHLMKRVDLLLEEVAMSTKRVAVLIGASALVVLGTGVAAVWAFPLQQPAAEQAVVAEGGIAGGVAGGVSGGVPGGVEGGVPGGVAGGVAGGVKGDKAKHPERKLVYKVNPVYPPELKEERVEGVVQLEVKVEAAGDVSSVRPLSGHPGLAESAATAVRQWRYAPADTGAMMTITINYKLAKDKEK